METTNSLVGRKMKGFYFRDIENVCHYSVKNPWGQGMDVYMGFTGTIMREVGETVYVKFADGKMYFYPNSLALQHLEPEEPISIFKNISHEFGLNSSEKPDNSNPLSLQEAKDKVAEKHGYSSWKAFVTYEIHKHPTTGFWNFIEEAAELHCQSQLAAKDARIRELEEEVNRLSTELVQYDNQSNCARIERDNAERENARLKEQLQSADSLIKVMGDSLNTYGPHPLIREQWLNYESLKQKP